MYARARDEPSRTFLRARALLPKISELATKASVSSVQHGPGIDALKLISSVADRPTV